MRRWFPGTTPRGWDLRRIRPWAWPFPGTRPVAPRASVVDRFVIRGDARLTEPRLRQHACPEGASGLSTGAPLSLWSSRREKTTIARQSLVAGVLPGSGHPGASRGPPHLTTTLGPA